MKIYIFFNLSLTLLFSCLGGCGGGDMPQAPDKPLTTVVADAPTAKRLSITADSAVNLQDAISVLKMIVGLDINSNGTPFTA